MGEYNINSAAQGNAATYIPEITIDSKSTEGVQGTDETSFINTNWGRWYGIYRTIPEVKIAIDMRATWTGGGGYEADARTTSILDNIYGCGVDNFNSIIKNMRIVRRIGGDSFAEIVRDEETGILLNLKPLDPGSIKIIYNKKGMIIRYEQEKNNAKQTFKPSQILHLTNKRVADEGRGISDIEAIEQIILANKESFVIQEQVMKNYAKPKMMVEIDSDDLTKIEEFMIKFDKATATGDNLGYPKGTVQPQVLAVSPNATLNILPWREHLKNYFYQVVGIPQIILGSANDFTESSAKIAYLAFEQSVDEEQNEDEEQIWNQLQLRVKWSFPTSLKNELISDAKKDGVNQEMQATINPAGMEE